VGWVFCEVHRTYVLKYLAATVATMGSRTL
jgi:hypothetical protein